MSASEERVKWKIFPSKISAEAEINAPPDRVWQILMDFEHYSLWNAFCPSIETDFKLGSAVEMKVRLVAGKKPIHKIEHLNLIEPGYQFAWEYSIGGRHLLKTNRYQLVEDLGDGRCRYYTTVQLCGLLAPVVSLMHGKHIREGFLDTALGLKVFAESRR